MDKKLMKRLIALVLTGGILISSTGVYTALAASEEYTTSEYTSALVGSDETATTEQESTTAPSTTESDTSATTEAETTTEKESEKETEATSVDVQKPATTVPPETTTKPPVIIEETEDKPSNNKAGEWVGVDGTTANMGTESNPYAVSSVDFFLRMNEIINDTGNANKYFQLTADIDFSGTVIDQTLLDAQAENCGIGGTIVSVDPAKSSNSNVFFHLNGNGKKIVNVTMKLDVFASLSIFGYVNSASTIENLWVSKSNITNGYSDAQAAGIILKNEGSVKECGFTEIVVDTTASTTKAESFFPDNTTLRTYSGTAIVVDNSGVIDSETNFDNDAIVKLNTAENITIRTSRPYAGAMVAQNRGKINKIRAVMVTIKGDTAKSDYVGGLVGTNATQRTSSATGMYYCEIQMDGRSSSVCGADKIGFLVGHNTGRIQRASVIGSFKTSEKATALNYDLLVTGASAAGGIVGDNTGDVQLCTVTDLGVYFADATDGAIYGGIAGKSNYSIRNSIATGSTAGAGTAHEITRYIGGIVGYGDTGNNFGVENCYALVKIIDSKAPLGAIVGFNGDTAYKNNKVRNVFYSGIISSRPSPVSYGGAGVSEGDLEFSKPYAMAYYSTLLGTEYNTVKASASDFGFSGWGDATFNVKGNFSGTQNGSYYTLTGLGTNSITYRLSAEGKADKTVVYYDVDIAIPSSIGADKDGTTLVNEPMELGILNAGYYLPSQLSDNAFVGTKDKPIKLATAEINFLYYAPAAHFVVENSLSVNQNFTAPAATFWGTINGNGNEITYEVDRDLFKGIYGSRDDSLTNNNSTTHKSDSSDEADVATNLTNGVIKNVTFKINKNEDASAGDNIGKRVISSVFGNICNATVKNTNITFYNAVTVKPTEGNTGLFAKAIYGNSYLYGCYVDSEYYNGNATSNIEANYDGIAGFVGIIDAEKAIIDNCGADVTVNAYKSNMKNLAVFAGQIKSLDGGYIQNCYSAGGIVRSATGSSFDNSSCNLFAGNIQSSSSETHIYNSYYSPAHAYTSTNGGKYDLTTGIRSGAYTGSCKVWSFQMQNASSQVWGDISLKVSAATDILYLESINNIDRFDMTSYSDATTDLNNYFTAASSNADILNFTNFRWYGRIGLSTTFAGDKNASAYITVKHNNTGLVAKLTVFNSSDLEIDDDGYYLIKTPVDLYYLSTNQKKLVSGSTEFMYISSNSKIKLAADIDMSGHVIEPIGTAANYFKGEFVAGKDTDGSYFTISNLSFDQNNLDHALFGYVQGATIKGIHMDSSNITGTSYTAAIVGTVYDYALIEDCKVTNSVISGQNHVGAIVGGINEKDSAQKTEIKNCTVENTVITSTKNSKEHAYLGGIVGGTNMNDDEACYAEITGCTVTNCDLSASAYGIGGIVGYAPNNNNTVASCTVTGTNLTSTGTNGPTYASLGAVAGLFGGSSLASCTVTDCTVTGECASGVVGRLINKADTTSTISACTVSGSTIEAPDIAGGILAQVSVFATDSCYGDKVVDNCKVSADTTVKSLVAGGIVGNVQQFSNKNLTVSNCTNLGIVETTGKKGSITDAAGGIIGRISSGMGTAGIQVTGCLSQGTVKGNSNLGGIIGMNNANAHTGENKLIKDCYVTTEFESSNLAVVKGLAIGYLGYQTKNNPSAFAENVVFSSLDTREALFGNSTEASGGFDMNKGADQTRGITVDFTTTIRANVANRFYPYYAQAIVDYKDGMMGNTNVVELRTNYYIGNGAYEGFGTTLSYVYNGTTYTLPQNASALGATTVPRFSVGNLPVLTGTDGNEFAVPETNVFSTTVSSSKIIVGSSATYNKLTDVNIQTFDKKCNATVKTTYTGIINGETVTFDVGFTVIVRGEHAFDTQWPITDAYPAGSDKNPFCIYTAEDLLSIKQHHDNPSDKDDFKDNPDFYYEASYIVMNDITDMKAELDGKSFAPIGTESEPFKGKILTYRGLQYKISDLLINITGTHTNENYAYDNEYTVTDTEGNKSVEYSDALGLFGYTDGAEIYNLEFVDVQILSVPGTNNGFIGTKSGALVGVANNTVIQNVKVTGASSVAIDGSFGGRAGAVGGIVGWAGNDVKLTDVSVIGADNENRIEVKGQYWVGGIVGSSADTTGGSLTNPVIENVNVTNLATSGMSIAGGIAGLYSGVITGTSAVLDEENNIITEEKRVSVNNVSVLGMVVGGVVGSGNIANLTAGGCDLTIQSVDVKSTNVEVTDTVRTNPNAVANGIAGGILGQTKDSYHYYITDCMVDGNTTVTSGYCAGGIVGSASNRGKGQLQTETCLIISDCTTLAKVNQLNAPTSDLTNKPSKTVMSQSGAGSVIGVITSNAFVMNEETKAPQIQVKNVTAGGEISGTFNVGGIIGSFATYQGKLYELTDSLIYDCVVSAKITPLPGATDSFGIILGEIVGNQKDPYNEADQSQTVKVSAPFPEQDSNGNTIEYSVRVIDKIFYSSYTVGDYNFYGLSAVKDYQGPDTVNGIEMTAGVSLGVDVFKVDDDGDGEPDRTIYPNIYDVNKVMYNFVSPTDQSVTQLPVSVVTDGFVATNPSASYQWFGDTVYEFSTEFQELLAANDGSGTPFGFSISGKDFTLVETDGIQSSNKEIFEVIPNDDGHLGVNLEKYPYKIKVKQFNTADLVFTYTNGLQIGIPVICGVNFEGEGTAKNPIQVANADIFYHIVKVLPSYSFIQTADIDLSDESKYPATMVSQIISNFTGTYDGQGHTITGFDVTIESSESSVGIFGKVSGTKYEVDEQGNQVLDENNSPIVIPNVQNLTFVDCSVNSGETSAGTGIAIGELANGATVSNIKVVNGENNNSSAESKLGNVGGAIGIVTGASKVDGVTVEGTKVYTEKGSAGGAVGVIVEDSAVLNSPVVKNTTVTSGTVDAEGNYLGSNSFEDIAGGIVAQARGTIIGPAAVTDEETGETVYPNAVEDVTVRAQIAGGAVGAVYKTNTAESDIVRNLILKDIRVSGVDVSAKSYDGTRATSGAGLLGLARAKANVELNNCYVNNTTKTSVVASSGGVSYGAGAVAQVDENVVSLKLIDTESYAKINSQESDKDGTVHAASLVAYMNNAPAILSFDGCVAGGKITGKAMKTFVGGVIGGFTEAYASNEITHEIFKNGVISAELQCIDGLSDNTTLKSVHRIGKFIAGYADGMFVEANFPTMFQNNYYSTYPNDIAFFATESGDKGPLDAYLAQVENGFTDINNNNLEIADEFHSGWNKVAITKAIGSSTKLFARLSEKYAKLPYGSETNRRDAVATDGFSLVETAKDENGNPLSCIDDPEYISPIYGENDEIVEFELAVKPTDYGAEMLVAEYTCGLKTTAQIISVEIEGEGTAESPFLISTPTQLRVVAYLAVGNFHFRQINDIPLNDSYASTGTDTDKFIHNNGGKFYAPIGTESAPFDGVYDGQGYKITGVKSDRGSENNIGVFGYVKQNGTLVPTIKNLHVELMAPDTKANGIVGNENVGGIAGYIENAVIENCSVAVGNVTGKQNVGGIAGNFTSSKIINCFTQSDVNAFNSEVAPYAGGIVGYVADAVNFGSKIAGCFASGSIFASAKSTTVDRSDAAGIVSRIENSTDLVVDSCLFTGTTSSGYGIAGSNGYLNFQMTISNCIDAGQNVAMDNDSFKEIPTAVVSASIRGTDTIEISNLYYDNALLKVNTNDYPDTETIKGKLTSELITTNVMAAVKDENGNDLWQKLDNHYPVPVVSGIKVVKYEKIGEDLVPVDDNGNKIEDLQTYIENMEAVTDPYSDAYAKFLSVPVQTSESEEESNIEKVAYGQGLVYPVTLLTNVDGSPVTYSSSVFDTTDTVEYPEGFDTKLYGIGENKNVDLLFGDDAETGKTTVYRNIFDTTIGIANRGNFETKPTKNTFVNAGAASGGVFSNGEAYYNAQTPIIKATAEINGVEVHRDIKLALSHGTTYCIATQRQLYALGKAEYELKEGAKFSNYYGSTYNYKLITDIDCGDNETLFTPIGLDVDEGYTGQFDGSGHTIKNLKIEQTGQDYVGMFSKLSKNWNSPYDPCIKNLTLENATVVATGTVSGGQTTGGNYVGTLVGHVMGSGDIVIENCHAIGHVEYKVDENGEFVFDENKKLIVEAYHGKVTGDGSYVGGLIGKVDFPTTIVKSCSSSVMVTGSRDAVGGLIGESASTVESCYATGNVICENIYNTQNTERVFGVGGLIGIMSNGTVNQSFASGNVEVKTFTSGNNTFVQGDLGIGGFVGVVKEMKNPVSQEEITGDVITECFSGGNVAFGTVNNTSAIRPYTSTAIVGVGGFSGINREGIAHVYSSAAVNTTFGDIIARNSNSIYGVGIGGVAGVALGNVEDVYSSGSVAPAYTSIDSSLNPDNCYYGVGGTVGTKMGSGATVRYCYYDSWTNTDPDLTSIGGQANAQEARGLTTLELTSGKKPANTNFSDVWGFTTNAYPYLKTLLKEGSDNYIKTNSILSVVCVNVADDDVSAKTGAGITQALTVPSTFIYLDENLEEHVYYLDWAGATLEGNMASPERTRNTRETVDVVAQVKDYEQYATRVYSRLCADMKGTFKQPYLISKAEDLQYVNMTVDQLEYARENFNGFYDQWATTIDENGNPVYTVTNGKYESEVVYYQLMSNIDATTEEITVDHISSASESYPFTITTTRIENDQVVEEIKDVNLFYEGFVIKGNGYAIKDVTTSGYFFGDVNENSMLTNIIFDDFTFTGDNSALVGINNGTLQDIYVKSTIGDGTADISAAAGLVQMNTGTIDGCMVDATIKGAAGNVGVMAVTNNGTIINSGTAGTLETSTGNEVTSIGAFVVNNNGTIKNSFSMADVNVLAAENAKVENVSGFAAINKGTIDSVYTRSAVSFVNTPEDTQTIASLVGTVTSTEAEPITNAYAAGLLGYYNEAQDSILFGIVPTTMNKLSSVYVDKSLAGQASKDSFKYSASLSSIMNMKYMADGMKYDETNNPDGVFIAGNPDELVLPQLAAILKAENHQVVDESGNLIYVDTESEDSLTYTLVTEVDDEGNPVRKYKCSDGNTYLADAVDNVVDENNNVIVPVERLKLQYAIYLEDKVVIRNYDVIKAYSEISSMTIKTAQSQYADFLAPNSSDSNLYDGATINSDISKVSKVNFQPASDIVGVSNSNFELWTNAKGGKDTLIVNYDKSIKLSRGMEINPQLLIDVGVSVSLSKAQINPNFINGMGTVNNPYVITSKEALTSLHYYGTESELYFVLGNDIDMSGVEDFQIHYFTAHLNDPKSLGDDTHQYAIENFSSEGHGGLFGTIEDGAVVNNVALTATINGTEQYTGALANIIKNASVTNCVVSADVTSTADVVRDDEGNIVGTPATGVLAGIVYNDAVISGIVTTGNASAKAGAVGGVIGYAENATMSEFLSTANVGEGEEVAGIVGTVGEDATLTNALYGGVAQSKKPIVGTYVDETAITETYYDNQTNKGIEAGTVIGTGKTTKQCQSITFNDAFSVVDTDGGYYSVPATIVKTIGLDGGSTTYESYGSTAALAATTMNFYLGSSRGSIGFYTSMRFEDYASGTLIDAYEVYEDGSKVESEDDRYFKITPPDNNTPDDPKDDLEKWLVNCLRYNETNPAIILELPNGAKRTICPGLTQNANVKYKIIADGDIYNDVNGKTLGVLLKSASGGEDVYVLNDFTTEVNPREASGKLDSFIIDSDEKGFYVSEMLPKGYEFEIDSITLNEDMDILGRVEYKPETFINLDDIKETDLEGETEEYVDEFNIEIILRIVKEDTPWGVNSIVNTLWNKE